MHFRTGALKGKFCSWEITQSVFLCGPCCLWKKSALWFPCQLGGEFPTAATVQPQQPVCTTVEKQNRSQVKSSTKQEYVTQCPCHSWALLLPSPRDHPAWIPGQTLTDPGRSEMFYQRERMGGKRKNEIGRALS